MLNYLIKLILVTIVSLFVAYTFYEFPSVPSHKENFDGYLPYIIFNLVLYLGYKIYTIFIDYKEKLSFSIFEIFSLFLIELGFFTWMFFHLNSKDNNFLTLFFSIFGYLVIPFLVVFISYSFGNKIINFIEEKYSENGEKEEKEFNFLMSLGLGFSLFTIFLVIIGSLGFYNIYAVFGLLIILGAISYKEVIKNFKNIFSYKFQIENHKIYSNKILDKINPYLLSTEFLFLFITMLISVNFISIFRAAPIGWDDMGVYMNYPNLMAHAGQIFGLGQMVSWQTITGIGYMFDSPTQAFFLNNLGAVLSTIVIIVSFYNLLKNKKTFINIPFLMASLFLAMPMVIFQQAKDMKLDIGLFFISSISVYATIYIFLKYIGYKDSPYNKCDISLVEKIKNYFTKYECLGDHKLFEKKKYLIYLFIIGIISGFAFSVKVTSLFLITGIIGIIAYSKLGFAGFLAYLSLFIGIFTKAQLWDYMGAIRYPKNPEFLNLFFIYSLVISLVLLAYSINKYKLKSFKRFFILTGIYLAGVFVILTPYFTKHIIELKNSDKKISIGGLISGTNNHFKADYTKIHSKEELEKIMQKIKKQKEKELSQTTTNEDMGRYFGYEKPLNNYLKMPWNLTMQANQGGEFTNITFIFLALIPIIFLFLRFKNNYFIAGILLFIALEFLLFYKPEYNIIPKSEINQIQIDKNIKNNIVTQNNSIFKQEFFGDNIYKIRFNDYFPDSSIKQAIKEQNIKDDFNKVKDNLEKNFYFELAKKIKSGDLKENTTIAGTPLFKNDFEYALKLNKLYNDYYTLKIKDLYSLEKTLKDEKNKEKVDKIKNVYLKYRNYNQAISDYLGKFEYPFLYSFILTIFLISLAYILYSLRKDKESQIFRLTAIFVSFYTFLWTISAFGIIWYGITMFYGFLLLIAIAIFYISSYDENDDDKKLTIKFVGSFTIFLIFSIYFFNSSYPHAFGNTLKNASWIDFKSKKIPGEDLIFLYDNKRFSVLSNLNIDENKQKEFLNYIIKDIKDENLKNYLENQINLSKNILDFKNRLQLEERRLASEIFTKLIQNNIISKDSKISNSYQILKFENRLPQEKKLFSALKGIKKVEHNLYINLLYTQKEFKSKANIFRIGTFYKYFITDNDKRLLEDSLLTTFDNYINTGNVNLTIKNIKKLGLKYILFDLNAATIDRDPRHDLTRRYEEFLRIITSDKVELLETDSICLKVALDKYKKDKNLSDFYMLAGVNYNSYLKNGKVISKNTKKNYCLNYIINLKRKNLINNNNYPYLQILNNLNEKEAINIIKQLIGRTGGMFALFKIKN